MDYIINPWWFYLANVVQKIEDVSIFATAFCGFAIFLWGIGMANYDVNETPLWRKVNNNKKIIISIFLVSIAVNVLIPSKNTIYAMIISSFVTKQNIQDAHDFVKGDLSDMVDKITESAIKVKESEAKE